MSAAGTPTEAERRLAGACLDVLARVDLVMAHLRAGQWPAACDQARRLTMLSDRLVRRLTVARVVDGQSVLSAAGFEADAVVVLALMCEIADPVSPTTSAHLSIVDGGA